MKRLILIDSHALIHRAYHALPPLSTKSGELVNAVYGFTSILIKTVSDFKPDYIVAAFDAAGPTFRHEEYKEYKATRQKAPDDLYAQIPKVKEILQAFKIPIFEKSGFEADDIIGTVSKSLKGKNIEVLILTGDMDNFQLVSKNIKVLYSPPSAAKEQIIYDAKKVAERFEGLKPDQLIDFKGLKGDPSDNIPGVKGIGEKTAIALIRRFGNLENLYEAIEKGRVKELSAAVLEKLKTGKKTAFFSKKMVTIKQNVPIKFNLLKSKFGKFDKEKLFNLLKELGFVSLINRLENSASQGMLLTLPSSPKETEYFKVPEEVSFKKLLEGLSDAEEIFIGFKPDDSGELAQLALSDGKNIYKIKSEFSNLKNIFENEKIKKIGHNLKFLLKALNRLRINLKGINFDIELAAYILSPGGRGYDLGNLILKELGKSAPKDPDDFLIFGVGLLRQLKTILLSRLTATGTVKLFEEIEMPLIPILSEMEMTGIKVNAKKLKILSNNIKKHLNTLEKNIYQLAGEKFNINSPQQLSEILFLKLKIPGALSGGRIRKTPGGALSTGAAELEKLKSHNKILILF